MLHDAKRLAEHRKMLQTAGNIETGRRRIVGEWSRLLADIELVRVTESKPLNEYVRQTTEAFFAKQFAIPNSV